MAVPPVKGPGNWEKCIPVTRICNLCNALLRSNHNPCNNSISRWKTYISNESIDPVLIFFNPIEPTCKNGTLYVTNNCCRINKVPLFKVPRSVICHKRNREEQNLHNENGGHYNSHFRNRSFGPRSGRSHLIQSLSRLLAVLPSCLASAHRLFPMGRY